MSVLWACIVHETSEVLNLIPGYCRAIMSSTMMPDKLILVDSDSSDKIRQVIAQENVGAIHIGNSPNGRNHGFHSSFNKAVRIAVDEGFEWLATMTVRAIPNVNWLSSAYSAAVKNSTIGMVTTLHESIDSPDRVHSFGHFLSPSGACLDYGRGLSLSHLSQLNNQLIERADGPIWAPCSGGALYRVKALRECAASLGDEGSPLFNESGFMSYDCHIFGFLMRAAGYKNTCAFTAVSKRTRIGSFSSSPESKVVLVGQELNRLAVVYSYWPPDMAKEAIRLYQLYRQCLDKKELFDLEKRVVLTLAENLKRDWEHKEVVRVALHDHLELCPSTLKLMGQSKCPGQIEGY